MPQDITHTDILYPDWNTQSHAYHNVRALCDLAGLTPYEKNLLCACIWQESRFHQRAIGRVNFDGTMDFGLCQYNNGRIRGVPMWIGRGAAFADTREVMENPEKGFRLMIKMYKTGHLNWWSSYSTGAYRPWLNPNSYINKFTS